MRDSLFRREILFLFVAALMAYYLVGIALPADTNRPQAVAITAVCFIVIYYLIISVYGLINKKIS